MATPQHPIHTCYADLAQDSYGYLLDPADWTPATGQQIAAQEQVPLDEQAWQVILAMHHFYKQYQMEPTMRAFIAFLRQDVNNAHLANSILLHTMFPGGVLKQLCKIAGLPRPKRCFNA